MLLWFFSFSYEIFLCKTSSFSLTLRQKVQELKMCAGNANVINKTSKGK